MSLHDDVMNDLHNRSNEYIDGLIEWERNNPVILPSMSVAVFDDDALYPQRQFHGYARVISTEFDRDDDRWYADVQFQNGIKIHLPCVFMRPVRFKVDRQLMRLIK